MAPPRRPRPLRARSPLRQSAATDASLSIVSPSQDSAMAVIRIGAQAHVREHHQLRHGLLDDPNRPLYGAHQLTKPHRPRATSSRPARKAARLESPPPPPCRPPRRSCRPTAASDPAAIRSPSRCLRPAPRTSGRAIDRPTAASPAPAAATPAVRLSRRGRCAPASSAAVADAIRRSRISLQLTSRREQF